MQSTKCLAGAYCRQTGRFFLFSRVVEAANNRKAFFVQKIDDNFYLGFAITTTTSCTVTFISLEIDPETKPQRVPIDFSKHLTRPEWSQNEETKLIYAISDSAIAVYNYNFEKVDVLKFN